MLYLVGGPGNAERVDVIDLFTQHLASFGLDVDYVIYERGTGPAWRRQEWHGATAFVVGRTRYTGVAGAAINKLYELGADLRVFWMCLRSRYDLIQIRDKFVSAILCLAAARFRRVRFTYWLSYPYPESRVLDAKEGRALVPWLSLIGGKISAWLLYRIIMPGADHVFVQSEQMLRDVAAQRGSAAHMSAVPMGVSAALLRHPPVAVEPNTLVYLGTLIRVRHLEVLIEALAIVKETHPRAQLVFVGDGEGPEDADFLRINARKLGLENAVEFTGRLPMDAAHRKTAVAAVCLSPFYPTFVLRSASPTKLAEYMALGRPVVANSHPEQSRMLEQSGGGICVEWSAADFATGICALLSDPETAERMGCAGREYIRKHRVYSVIARQVADQYRAVLAESIGLRRA